MIYFIFKCKLSNGANFIFKKQKIKQYIKRNDIVISGEGKLDKTTFEGKGLSKNNISYKKSRKKLYLVVGKSELKKVNYGKIVNLRFKNKPTKANFIETLKKKVNTKLFR